MSALTDLVTSRNITSHLGYEPTMASDLTKKQLLELTGIAPGQLQTLSARVALPFAINQTETGRGYSVFEGFLLLLADQFAEAESIAFVRAVDIVVALPDVMVHHWPEIVRTGHLLAEGTTKPVRPILVGRVSQPHPGRPLPVCGSGKAIETDISATGIEQTSTMRISASRVMALLISRARQHNIRIPPDFWESTFKYRPRPPAMTPEEMAAAIEEKLHAES